VERARKHQNPAADARSATVGGESMDRIFWVKCPGCTQRFYCDWTLRHAGYDLICPYCHRGFLPDESPELDERWFSH
jgi:hypothetical protein